MSRTDIVSNLSDLAKNQTRCVVPIVKDSNLTLSDQINVKSTGQKQCRTVEKSNEGQNA